MELFFSVMAIIFIVILSSILHKKFDKVSVIFFQIGLGIILYLVPYNLSFNFDPEIFIVCFIAPILFYEGRKISLASMLKYKEPIMLMSFALVILTIACITALIYHIIPGVSLSVSFMIAAILSPTDSSAAKSLIEKRKLPKGLIQMIESESLLNDDLGLISFKLILTAILSGSLKKSEMVTLFGIEVIGGIVFGLVLGYMFIWIPTFLKNKQMADTNAFITFQLVSPFIIYLLAQQLHFSGFFAVVFASLIFSAERETLHKASARFKLFSGSIWDFASYILTGFVFVLIGYSLPEELYLIVIVGKTPFLSIMMYTILISLFIWIIRFITVYIFKNVFERDIPPEKRTKRLTYALINTFCGVRGALTIAMAFSVPLYLNDNSPFPFREYILFLAGGTFIVQIVVSALVMPKICSSKKECGSNLSFLTAKKLVILKSIDKFHSDSYLGSIHDIHLVLRIQEEKIIYFEQSIGNSPEKQQYFSLVKLAVNVEKQKATELYNSGVIDLLIYDSFMKHLDKRLSVNRHFDPAFLLRFLGIGKNKLNSQINNAGSKAFRYPKNLEGEALILKKETLSAAIEALSEAENADNRMEVILILQNYRKRLGMLPEFMLNEEDQKLKEFEIGAECLRIERDALYELDKEQSISHETYIQLTEWLNYEEILLISSIEH